ncbi:MULTISPECIES: Imm1 family immunity protein [Actinosynnema]|uniref:Imm1 family immunity protein n=1 Tax=Actinosynnema TaxID=40566 RepID=UPI0020A5FF71|nr:Imm1 family immunity protein [Actinosynnema pretiosum]MCP2093896.1 Immunity protein Imm1 [Actinosynnema pretiosum]
MALEAWYDWESDGPTIVRTTEELDRVLDRVVGWEGPALVELLVAENLTRAVFDVGLNGKIGLGTLYYSGGGSGRLCSLGASSGEGNVLYYYMNSDTEFPLSSEVPLDLVRQAAHEYMSTGGERPTVVDWQPLR